MIYQENHSFDETLGFYCGTRAPKCDGDIRAVRLKDGSKVSMTQSPDIVPEVNHSVHGQQAAIDRGRMDGWATIGGCAAPSYGCLTYYTPSQIPNLATLADHFTVSDRTFSLADSPSWGGHLYAAAATLDGFTGDRPRATSGVTPAIGWGCDSNKVAPWTGPHRTVSLQPACVPNPDGTGAFKATLVPHVSTIFDSLDAVRDSWKIYGAPVPAALGDDSAGYGWSICPSFAGCLYTSQVDQLVPSADILGDAANGNLPSYSVLTPSWSSTKANGGADASQHNSNSMLAGDNWIGRVVSAIQNGPDWASTAIFITYDDCGCFYDHVRPAPQLRRDSAGPAGADGDRQPVRQSRGDRLDRRDVRLDPGLHRAHLRACAPSGQRRGRLRLRELLRLFPGAAARYPADFTPAAARDSRLPAQPPERCRRRRCDLRSLMALTRSWVAKLGIVAAALVAMV